MAEEWSAVNNNNNSQFPNLGMQENNQQPNGEFLRAGGVASNGGRVYGLSSLPENNPFQVSQSEIDGRQTLALMNTTGHVNPVAGEHIYGLPSMPEHHSFQVSRTENNSYCPSVDGRQNFAMMNTNGHGNAVKGSQIYGFPSSPENNPFQAPQPVINTYNPSVDGRHIPGTLNANGRNSGFSDPFQLEAEFSRLSLLNNPSIFCGAVGGGDRIVPNNNSLADFSLRTTPYSQSQVSYGDLQRMRIQSAARGQNMKLYAQPRNYPTLDDGFDESSLQYALNSNSNSRYDRSFSGETFRYPIRPLAPSRNASPLSFRMGYGNQSNLIRYRYGLDTNGAEINNSSLFRSQFRPSFSSLDDLMGKIFLAAKDQHGCRFLQRKIEQGKPEDIQMIFSEVKAHIRELMVNQFGNCLVQKLFEVCNQVQMDELLELVMEEERILMAICLDMHGTRAMQKLLEHLTTREQKSTAISVLGCITVPLTKSLTGHHVIQHSLKFFSSEENKHVLNVVAENCLDIATDKSGCCVIQQCVAHAQGEPRDRLVQEITANASTLSDHPYGNYVVQYILGLKIPHVTKDILNRLSGSYVQLSMSKYGSNVVEKCLKESEEDEAAQIVNELFNSPKWLRIIENPFGNYVAQSALEVSKGTIRSAMVNFIHTNFPLLNSHPHGKRVLARTRGNKNRG